MNLLKGTFAYVVCTFAVQAISHFVIFKDHYAAVTFLRPDPVFALGVLSMLTQGLILSYLYLRHGSAAKPLLRGWRFGVLAGAFFASYSILAEPAKYAVPNMASWMMVEAIAGFFQFSLFGLALGWLYRSAISRGIATEQSFSGM